MVYIMEIYADGACRGNGRPGSIGAAAAVFKDKRGNHKNYGQALPRYPPPTNQRAEITALVIALEQALEQYENLSGTPLVQVMIYSDSRYAVGCMNEWLENWLSNGWRNSKGEPVSNQDLIEEASDLAQRLRSLGSVTFRWIPRAENTHADAYCNFIMDNM